MKRWWLGAGLAGLLVMNQPVEGQETLSAKCDHEIVMEFARDTCLAAAQALVSAQPALGIAIGGGNPTLGSAGGAGLRLGVVPRVSAGLRLNVVAARLPDLLTDEIDGQAGDVIRRYGAPLPAASGDISIGIFNGLSYAPGVGGIGGISLLGSATYLPLSLLTDGFDKADLGYGIGGRLHLLSESFVTPGMSVSLMRKKLPTISFGDICPGGLQGSGPDGDGIEYGGCLGEGDVGEFQFDLIDWSARFVVSKHFLGLGATAGIGWDQYTSEIGFGFRGDDVIPGTNQAPVFRVSDQTLEATQWSMFGNLAYTLLVATFGLEVGWQQGMPPITGFQEIGSDFDPRAGTWFASLGLRLAL